MNERIRELVKRAGGHFSTRNLMSNPVQQRESIELWDDRIEKFAELIVEECISLSLNEMVDEEEIDKQDDIEDRCYLRGNNGGIVDSVVSIRQHFGVEE